MDGQWRINRPDVRLCVLLIISPDEVSQCVIETLQTKFLPPTAICSRSN